jgi:predicted lysophospholipase L1 biosynthesis ABC-type transport system permease subunit
MPDGTRVEVVGLAENGKYSTLTEDPHPAMFLPILQWPSNTAWMVVRSGRDAHQLSAEIRQALHKADPGIPVQTETRYDEMATVLFGPKMATIALGVLGVIGAMLSITGIFGLAAYTVSKRLRELGIRVALGAKRGQVLRAALDRACKLLAFGSAAGLGLGLFASRILALVVYQATPRDPVVLLGVVIAMLLIGIMAASLPARRALSIDTAILLRDE